MRRMALFACVAAAGGLAFTVATSLARADECDDIVAAMNKRMTEIRATRKEGDTLPTLCARMGRISGLSAAVTIVAQECFDAGSKRDAVIKDAAMTESMLEIATLCK